VRGVAPVYLERGRGARVWDVDGNCYLDYNMAIGPLVLGYAHPAVDEAIRRQLDSGITFSLMHPLEVEVAELLAGVIPNAEAVRFSKTGAEVTSAAVRLARAFTGREKILCCGYHGWHDWYITVTDRRRGVPASQLDLTYTFDYNDPASLDAALDAEVAAVIMEPVVFQPPRPGFLEYVQESCRRRGALLIFDEMWTGFRLAVGGAQEFFGIQPDLACYSKAIANGMPLAVLTGRREIMKLLERDVFFFTTFGGEALSLAAAKATIAEIREKNVPAHLARLGKKLKEGYNQLAARLGMDYTRCVGYDCRTLVTFDERAAPPLLLKSLLQQELLRCGILWSGFHTLSFSHCDEDIDYTLAAYAHVLPLLARAVRENKVAEHLRGEPVEPVFRKTSHFHSKPRPPLSTAPARQLEP
ncbi:MAG: aminotransferase class III-fold pyridoxal phosphate-dependent enzyme, partial [candidate division KSB1 bacterium]|nr:aminotransferase class III-fold pyridoxal phosphate-dependent enzyme [candidate division KSB1 bacterium]